MQGMCAAHWQAALAAVAASGGMSAAVAAAEAIGRLLLVDALFSALALVAAECPAVVGAPFQALVQEACSPGPQVTPCNRNHEQPKLPGRSYASGSVACA